MTDETRQPTGDDDLTRALEETATPASEAHGNPGHDTADQVARGARLVRLRAQRLTYAQIAEEEGYADAASARNALMRALKRHEAENVTELRALENLGLDTDERALRAIISDRGVKAEHRIAAVNARTRVSARRARLNGLDAPLQVQVSAGVAAELADALAEAEALFTEVVPGMVLAVHDEEPDERMEG